MAYNPNNPYVVRFTGIDEFSQITARDVAIDMLDELEDTVEGVQEQYPHLNKVRVYGTKCLLTPTFRKVYVMNTLIQNIGQ